MRGAPPVQMACGRDARVAVGVGLLSGAAAASFVGWLAWHAGLSPGLLLAAAAVAALGGGGVGWQRVDRLGERRLAWDGRSWTLDGVPGEVLVMIDTGNWMQLQFHAAGAVLWTTLGLSGCGAPTHLARAALMAHACRLWAGGATLPSGHG